MNNPNLKEVPSQNYTGHGWEGKNYNINLGIKEIAKIVREKLKKQFPECKFSVTFQRYAGGRSMSVKLMEAPYAIFNSTEEVINKYQNLNSNDFRHYTEEEIVTMFQRAIESGYHQVNNYYIKDDYYINEKGKEIMEEVKNIIISYNYDDSDGMIDYFSTNFYYNIGVGKYEKPFQLNNLK